MKKTCRVSVVMGSTVKVHAADRRASGLAMSWDIRYIAGIDSRLMCRNVTIGLITLLLLMSQEAASGSRRHRDRNQEMPRFLNTPQNITVGPGDRAVLKCRVENLGTKTVTWRRHEDMHPLTIGLFTYAPDVRITVDYNQRANEWSLIIQNVKPEDEGTYHCEISTRNERENSYSIKLNVKTVQVSGTEYVERRSQVQLMCNATGKPDPPHNVEWYKDGHKINSDAQGGIIITKKIETKVLVSLLVIQSSKLTDAGDYICRSSNKDTGIIKVHILNGTSVERITAGGSFSVHSGSRLLECLTLSWIAALVTLIVSNRWRCCLRV